MAHFDVSLVVATLGLSLYVFAYGIGPLVNTITFSSIYCPHSRCFLVSLTFTRNSSVGPESCLHYHTLSFRCYSNPNGSSR